MPIRGVIYPESCCGWGWQAGLKYTPTLLPGRPPASCTPRASTKQNSNVRASTTAEGYTGIDKPGYHKYRFKYKYEYKQK